MFSTSRYMTRRFTSHVYAVWRKVEYFPDQIIHKTPSHQASQPAGEARQKRVREGAGLTGSARLAGAPRICLSPHFSRKWYLDLSTAEPTLSRPTPIYTSLHRWKYVNRYVSTLLLRSQHGKHHNHDSEPAPPRKTARPKGSSLTFVLLQ